MGASFKEALAAIVKGDGLAPDPQQLHALQAAAHAALQDYKADGCVDADVAALMPALCKCASQLLTGPAAGHNKDHSILTDLLCLGMDTLLDTLLDTTTTPVSTSPKDLHLLLYHGAKRLLVVGQVLPALQQGLKLRTVVSTAASYAGLQELQVAVGLHLVVCASELSPAATGDTHLHLVTQVLHRVPQLLGDIRSSPEPRKHMESVFKCMYKVISNSARLPDSPDHSLASEAFTLFIQAAQDIQQHTKLPQYITRLLCDLKENGVPGLVMAVLGAGSNTPELLVGCVEAVMRGVWEQQDVVTDLLASTRWQACCDASPGLALHYTALALHSHLSLPTPPTTTTAPAKRGKAPSKVKTAPVHQQPLSGLLEQLSTRLDRFTVQCEQHEAVHDSVELSAEDIHAAAVALSGLQQLNKALSVVLAGRQAAPSLLCGGWPVKQLVMKALLPAADTATAMIRYACSSTPDVLAALATSRSTLLKSGMSAAAAALCLITHTWLCCDAHQTDTWPTCNDLAAAVSRCCHEIGLYTSEDDGGDLQWMAAFAAALGKELTSQPGLEAPSAHVMQVAWCACSHRVHLLLAQGEIQQATDEVPCLERRARAYASALLQAEQYQQAMDVAVAAVMQLCKLGSAGVQHVSRLIQLHVTARLHVHQQTRATLGAAHHDKQQQDKQQQDKQGKARGKAPAGGGKAHRSRQHAPESPAQVTSCTPALLVQALIARAGDGQSSDTCDSHLVWHVLDVVAFEEGQCYERAAGKTEDVQEVACIEVALAQIPVHLTAAVQSWPGLTARAGLLTSLLQPPHYQQTQINLDQALRAARLFSSGGGGGDGGGDVEVEVEDDLGPAVPDLHRHQALVLHCSAACVMLSIVATQQAVARPTQEQGKAQAGTDKSALSHALLQWQHLTDLLSHDHPQNSAVMCAPKPEVCLNLALQLWQVCHVQDHTEGMSVMESAVSAVLSCTCHARPSRFLASLLALMRPGVSCLTVALSPQPAASLAEHTQVTDHCPEYVQALIAQLAHARSAAPTCSSQATAEVVVSAAGSALQEPSSQHGHQWVLHQVQVLHMSAAAHMTWGNTDMAWADTQQALRLSSALHSRLGFKQHIPASNTSDAQQGGTAGSSDQLSASNGQDNSLNPSDDVSIESRGSGGSQYAWLCCSAYLCSLIQAAYLDEVIGHVEEALCLLQECIQAAAQSGAAATGVVAMQRSVAIMIGQGKLADAQALLTRADEALAAVTGSNSTIPSSNRHVLSASSAQLHAQLSCATATVSPGGDQDDVLGAALRHYASCHSHLSHLLSESTWAVHAATASCTAHMGAAELYMRYGHVTDAQKQLMEAEQMLQGAVQAVGCEVGPEGHHNLIALSTVVNSHKLSANSTGSQGQPVAFRSTLPWPDLHAQLLVLQDAAATLADTSSSTQHVASTSLHVLGLCGTTRQVVDDVDALKDQLASSLKISHSKPVAKAGRKTSGGATGSGGGHAKTAAAAAGGVAAAGQQAVGGGAGMLPLPARLSSLLKCFLLSSCHPRTHKHVCEVLVGCTAQLGLLHAPCMFNHLALGADACVQLAASAAYKCMSDSASHVLSRDLVDDGTQRGGSSGSEVCTDTLVSSSNNSDSRRCRVAAAAAIQATAWLHSSVACVAGVLASASEHKPGVQQRGGATKAVSCAPCSLQAIEDAAAAWLQSAVCSLPGGCAVTSITTSPVCARVNQPATYRGATSCKQFMVCRLSPGATPLALVLHTEPEIAGPDALHSRDDVGPMDLDQDQDQCSSSTSVSTTSRAGSKSRQRSAAPATNNQCIAPAAQRSHDGAGQAGGQQDAASRLLQQLAQLLQDSSASMSDAAALHTTEAKADWWRTRLSLDTRMSQLLTDMQSTWLTPWGCLMLLQSPAGTCEAVQPTVRALTQQYFSHVVSGTPHSVMCEMLTILLSCAHQLPQQQLHLAVSQLCCAVDVQLGEEQLRDLCSSVVAAGAGVASTAQRPIGAQEGQPGGQRSQQQQAGTVKAGTAAREVSHVSMDCDLETCRRDAVAMPSVGLGVDAAGAQPATSAPSNAVTKAPGAGSKVSKAKGSRLKALSVVPGDVAVAGVVGGSRAGVRAVAAAAQVQAATVGGSSRSTRQTASDGAGGGGGGGGSTAAGRGTRTSRTVAGATKAAAAPLALPVPPPPATSAGAAYAADTWCLEEVQGMSSTAVAARCRTGSEQQQVEHQEAAVGCGQGDSAPPLLLALSPSLHALPWESMPCMQSSRVQVYRIPGLVFAAAMAAHLLPHVPPSPSSSRAARDEAAAPSKPTSRASRASAAETVAATSKAGSQRAGNSRQRAKGAQGKGSVRDESSTASVGGIEGAAVPGAHEGSSGSSSSDGSGSSGQCGLLVDLCSTWYLINPGGDLRDTQSCFETWFAEELHWQGCAGSNPGAQQLLDALQSHALFVYLGHGSGEQYLPVSAMHRLTSCAANLLMGCSSGRLRQHGCYGLAGAVLAYLAAGCPAVVANLWDVTDKDIDRFSTTVLKHWLNNTAEAQHAHDAAHSMSGAVASSRSVCKLPHLIGAAPVCYGLPVRICFRGEQQGAQA